MADSKTHIQKQSDTEEKMADEQISAGQSMGPKVGQLMKQHTFDWDTEVKYSKLKNFRLKVYNVFKSYDMTDIAKTALIKNWPGRIGRKGFQLLETLTQAEKRKM